MIFKGVRNGKPYPEHGLTMREWAQIPPRQFRLDQLTTVTTALALDKLLSEDSTFYGDLFAHAVRWQGETYLEDGLHRAVRSALRNRHVIHARLLDLDSRRAPDATSAATSGDTACNSDVSGADLVDSEVDGESAHDLSRPDDIDSAADQPTEPILLPAEVDVDAAPPTGTDPTDDATLSAPSTPAEPPHRPADVHGWTAPPDLPDAR